MNKFALALALVLTASAAVAQSPYSYYLHYHSNTLQKAILQSNPESVLGYDKWDAGLGNPPWFGPDSITVAVHKENGKYGWDADSEYLVKESRSPLASNQTEVFEDIYLWAQPAAAPGNLGLSIYQYNLAPGVTYTLRLVAIPQGVTYTGPTEWTGMHDPITLPFYSTDNPLTGYRFRAEFTAIPEPSSLLALFGGLAGLGGMRLRRRR
jgi:hypothetical protein